MQACGRNAAPLLPEVTIRSLQPEDIPGVANLMQEVYGGYRAAPLSPDPARIPELNARGDLISVVAARPGKGIIGYAAIRADQGGQGAGVLGSLAVSPAFRQAGLGEMILRHLVHISTGQEFRSLCMRCHTSHTASQQVGYDLGFHPCGILLGDLPEHRHTAGNPASPGRRESTLLIVRALSVQGYGPQFIPGQHREIILGIARRLGIPVHPATGRAPSGGTATMDPSSDPATGNGTIAVRRIGYGLEEMIQTLAADLFRGGAATLRLTISLSEPAAPHAVQAAEDAGFFFAGIVPGESGLTLCMQNLGGAAFTPGNLYLFDPAAVPLLRYIVAEEQCCGGKVREGIPGRSC